MLATINNRDEVIDGPTHRLFCRTGHLRHDLGAKVAAPVITLSEFAPVNPTVTAQLNS
jgi:hypothetical protein